MIKRLANNKILWCILFLAALLFYVTIKGKDMTNPPIADKISHISTIGNHKISDDYAWMRDPKWPQSVESEKILSYLNEENLYTKTFFDKHKTLTNSIFEELKARIELKDQSAPIKKDNYYYYTRIEEDQNYPIFCRKKDNMQAAEEILLDLNELAKDHKFLSLSSMSISPDHKLLAYNVDFLGNEKYTIKILNLETNEYLPDEISDTVGDIIWHKKEPLFFYTPVSSEMRHDKVMMHRLGTKEDTLIFHEPNPLYFVGISESNSKKYMFISASGHDDSESFYIDLESDNFKPQIILERKDKIQYVQEHHGDHLYILINDTGNNFRLIRKKINDSNIRLLSKLASSREVIGDLDAQDRNVLNIHEDPSTKSTPEFSAEVELQKKSIEEFIPETDKYLRSFDVTDSYLILNYKDKGLSKIVVQDFKDGTTKEVAFPDAAYSASAHSTNFDMNDIRISYSALSRPDTTYTYDFTTDKLSILKEKKIPSGFNPEEYQVERIWANNNGTLVPISLFYKKSLFKKDGSNPLYLYGYGSYGHAIEPTFRNTAVTLANRGFVFAIAHIRGGDDLGHDWYEAAKFLNKKLTFEDFISATEHLIKEKYTSSGNVVIAGGSAGGMLIGAVINKRPELYKAAIAHVPFVDVLNTMLDETLPLTPGEFKEWGNPKEPEYFSYMLSYSPYDNVISQKYPNIFVTAGISDPRVSYWEASKWVAKLRTNKTDNNLILLKTNMDSGHQGASGRFDYLKEIAEEYSFIFTIFNTKF